MLTMVALYRASSQCQTGRQARCAQIEQHLMRDPHQPARPPNSFANRCVDWSTDRLHSVMDPQHVRMCALGQSVETNSFGDGLIHRPGDGAFNFAGDAAVALAFGRTRCVDEDLRDRC